MKFFSTLGFVFLFIAMGEAQNAVGIRSGIFVSKTKYFLDEKLFFTSRDISCFEIGLVSRFKIGPSVSLSPEINFIQKGGEIGKSPYLITQKFTGGGFVMPMSFSYTYKSIFLKVETGFYGGFFLKGKYNSASNGAFEIEFNNVDHGGFKQRDFGAVFGAGGGVNFKKYSFSLNWRYRYPILNNSNRDYGDSSPVQQAKLIGWGIAAMVLYEL